ncbi:hypothetical protein [Streptococcus pluranimalium]
MNQTIKGRLGKLKEQAVYKNKKGGTLIMTAYGNGVYEIIHQEYTPNFTNFKETKKRYNSREKADQALEEIAKTGDYIILLNTVMED